jgi:hypothetical protein
MIMWQELQPDDPGRIGPYRLRGVLGSGGMDRVFLGAAADGQLVAVKVIRANVATDPEFRARFRREVTVAQKVSSRFTVPLIDADTDGEFITRAYRAPVRGRLAGSERIGRSGRIGGTYPDVLRRPD